ncbi:MAG: ribosomal protein S18-alanine N-acetyltransferase [Candidatus Sulfotelmatobacter sp.]
MRFRHANADDIDAITLLEQESETAAHWSRAQYEDISPKDHPQPTGRSAWVAEVPSEPAEILGFLVAHRIHTEWELENIVVSGSARRRGIGTRLLSEFIEHVRAEKGSAIFLEVRESNRAARTLYRKASFEETGVRKGYYNAPQENAVAYRRLIS